VTAARGSRGGRGGAARRLAAFAAVALAAAGAAGACSEATTDPNSPVSISFDSALSIVVGDTLRDPETGQVAPLVATAFNGKGDTIPNAPFTFFVRDTTGAFKVVGDTLIATDAAKPGTYTVFASVNGLQLPRTIQVVQRPDSLAAIFDTPLPTFPLAVPDIPGNVTPGASLGDTLKVRVLHDSSGTWQGVPSWIVKFEIVSAAPQLADSVRLVASATTAPTQTAPESAVDTTDGSGNASRRVRVFAKAGTAAGAEDTVVVRITATYQGKPLRGSPVTAILPLTRPATP